MPEIMHGLSLFTCAPDGPPLCTDGDAVQLIADASGADLVVLPAERLHEDFFQLRTRVAGEIVQKFATYRQRLAIVGDISAHVAASTSFRDFVHETNRGTQLWFVADLDELSERLAR